MKRQSDMVWTSRIVGLWFTVVFLCIIGVVHVVAAIQTYFFTALTLAWASIATLYFCVAAWFIVAFFFTYARLAVSVEITDGELRARGLFGQGWRIPLEDIAAFRDADIYRRGKKRPVLQVGVIAEGMRSFVEALREKAPNLKVVEIENIQKQGRW